MNTILAIGIFLVCYYYIIQFGQEEEIGEHYEEAILEVEGRLDWARSRNHVPFGMRAQMQVSQELLGKAKHLWHNKKWHQAYRVALQSQEALDKAQHIYIAAISGQHR